MRKRQARKAVLAVVVMAMALLATPVASALAQDGPPEEPQDYAAVTKRQWSDAIAKEHNYPLLPTYGHTYESALASVYGPWECPPWVDLSVWYNDPYGLYERPAGWSGPDHHEVWLEYYETVGEDPPPLPAEAPPGSVPTSTSGAVADWEAFWQDLQEGTWDPEGAAKERDDEGRADPLADPQGYWDETWEESEQSVLAQIMQQIQDAIAEVLREVRSEDPFGWRRFFEEEIH